MILAHTFPVSINTVPVTINQDMKAISPFLINMSLYVKRVLDGYSHRILSLTNTSTHGTKRLETNKSYGKLYYPLASLAEQQAIVERVDRLLASVSALEQHVQERKTYAEQLMQAVLKEAFAG
jgi:type I restriction enzyme S subunit